MSPETKAVGLRLPIDLIERIDGYAVFLESQTPGLRVTRTDAARILLERGLEAVAPGTARKRKR